MDLISVAFWRVHSPLSPSPKVCLTFSPRMTVMALLLLSVIWQRRRGSTRGPRRSSTVWNGPKGLPKSLVWTFPLSAKTVCEPSSIAWLLRTMRISVPAAPSDLKAWSQTMALTLLGVLSVQGPLPASAKVMSVLAPRTATMGLLLSSRIWQRSAWFLTPAPSLISTVLKGPLCSGLPLTLLDGSRKVVCEPVPERPPRMTLTLLSARAWGAAMAPEAARRARKMEEYCILVVGWVLC
ncbi:hypothetical protein B0H63DRAFT_464670 [Podospora didyma]|uniref:Uncharacterized protein n=1 Tax=Podospora didyma TaxID=330526 RepID=A0AAE0NYC5_9PEZI|nr:hypothetical protein B0H63DRAFT_464670 [Podospora didyma]